MKAQLRIGVIGIGFGQKVLVPAFAAEPHCKVTGICATDFERARRVADRLDLPKAYGNWEELVADRDIDVVGIATPPSIQPAIAVAALAGGKHVFCEKPIACNLEGASQMLAAARTSGRAHMVDFEFPEVPAWQYAKAILDSGALGQLTHVTVSWQVETYASRKGIRSWKTDAGMGGGALSSFASHSFYYLEWLIGPIRRLTAHLFPPAAPSATGSGDTLAALWLEHQNGVPSSLCISSTAFLGSGHRVEIYGQQGTVLLDNPSRDYISGFSLWHGTRKTNRLECVYRGQTEDAETDGRIAPVNSLVKRLVTWARDGIPTNPDFEDGFRVQRLLDAAYRSSDTGRRIELQ